MKLRIAFTIMLSFLSSVILAQQNKTFVAVKNYYDNQKELLKIEFDKRLNIDNELEKIKLRRQFIDLMEKIDSVQNIANINALIITKNEEELKPILNAQSAQKVISKDHKTKDKAPEYPGGIETLRKQVGELFYFDSNVGETKKITAKVSFIVEEDGHISNVTANGDNANFNRQAMIAVYLLPFKFSPSIMNGTPVRFRLSIPITMSF